MVVRSFGRNRFINRIALACYMSNYSLKAVTCYMFQYMHDQLHGFVPLGNM